jgi:hypothetical protein
MSSYPLLNVQNGRTWDISANNVTLVGLNGNGPAGYILVSAGTTVAPTWSATLPVTAAPTLADVMTAGNQASTFLDMSGNNISNGGTFTATTFEGDLSGNITGGLGAQLLYQSAVNTTAFLTNGTAGQVIQSNGTTLAPSWSSVPLALINIIYPIGSIIQSSVSTNPSSYITGTTWIAYGAGQVLVGKAGNQNLIKNI